MTTLKTYERALKILFITLNIVWFQMSLMAFKNRHIWERKMLMHSFGVTWIRILSDPRTPIDRWHGTTNRGHRFISSFEFEWSWINDHDPEHPKGMHPWVGMIKQHQCGTVCHVFTREEYTTVKCISKAINV